MKRMELLRRNRNLSQRELGKLASVNASYICNAERRGMRLFDSQAQRLAVALDWQGQAEDLFEEVPDDAC